MLQALTQADVIVWISILVKALAYAATLSAIGGVLVLATLRGLGTQGRHALIRVAIFSTIGSAVFTSLTVPVQASFLLGGTWDGAFDPVLLGIVMDSPLGASTIVRLFGLAFIFCLLWPTRFGKILTLAGAVLASHSFALRGHALSDPQMLLGTLITLHILCVSFWFGGFFPLIRSASREPLESTGALAREFGHKALWAVGSLAIAGGAMLFLFGVATQSALFNSYGQMAATKLVVVVGILSLAAYNKLSLTPALLSSKPNADAKLRYSIGVEAALFAVVLLITAALTTVSSPPAL